MSIESYPNPNGVLTSLIWRKTMSGAETTLSGYDNASQALSYTPGQEQVYLNGILLVRGDDYTATNGTSITGLSALSASDFVQVNCYNNFSVASVPAASLTGTVTNAQLANSAITINGSAISLGGTVTLAGDIESVTATSPLTGGGSTGALTVGIQDASTAQKGSVQLSDSTSTTSSILAATPTAVKSAYDLANGAIAKTLTTTAGDIIYASSANTPARLGIGSSAQVLTVASGVPSWAPPATASFVGASAYVAGTQSVPQNTITTINFANEDFDTNTFHDLITNNSRMTIPSGKAGKYLVCGMLGFDSVPTLYIQLLVNGGSVSGTSYGYFAVGGTNGALMRDHFVLTAILNLSVGDYVQLAALHGSSSVRTLEAGRLEIVFLGG